MYIKGKIQHMIQGKPLETHRISSIIGAQQIHVACLCPNTCVVPIAPPICNMYLDSHRVVKQQIRSFNVKE